MGWSVICGIIRVRVFCLCANVSSTMVGLWSVVYCKYVYFVCALMCLPQGLVCDLWYNSSTCLLSVRLCVLQMGWSVIFGIIQIRVFCLCANVSSTRVGL